MDYAGFIGPSYTDITKNLDAQRSVNLYVENDESGAGKSKAALIGCPGLAVFATLPQTPVRGILSAGAPLSTGARCFAVGGSKLYEITSGGVVTLLGDVGNDASNTPVWMGVNGNQLGIVSAGLFYIADGATVAAQNYPVASGTAYHFGSGALGQTSGDPFDATMVGQTITWNGLPYTVTVFYNIGLIDVSPVPAALLVDHPYTITAPVAARTGAFLDGYFIVAKPDSKQFNISAINDGTSWDPLDFGIKEGYPDNIGAILADHEELWLSGESTSEVWRNTGNADFPFGRDMSAFIQTGLASPWTLCTFAGGVAWLGADTRGNGIAYRANGYVPQRVSTHAVEHAWAGYSTIADAISWTYDDKGHKFWVLTFPTANATWCYDAATNLWHERGYLNGSTLERHRGRCHAFCFEKHLVGDHTNGKIYQMAQTIFADDGGNMYFERVAPHLSTENLWNFFHKLTIDMETGTGASPTVSLSWSDDNGHTFNTPRTTTAGTVAQWAKRVIFRRLGKSRDRCFKFTMTTNVKVALIAAYFDLTRGES